MECRRCRGLVVIDYSGGRCVNCGEISDPVILAHRVKAGYAPAHPHRGWPNDFDPDRQPDIPPTETGKGSSIPSP